MRTVALDKLNSRESVYALLSVLTHELAKLKRVKKKSHIFDREVDLEDYMRPQDRLILNMGDGIPLSLQRGLDDCNTLADYVKCSVVSLDAARVYLAETVVREISKRTKPIRASAVGLKRVRQLDGLEKYRPSRLRDQYMAIASEGDPFVLRPDQTNGLWDLVREGKIGYHVFLHYYRVREEFDIDEKAIADPLYRKFISLSRNFIDHGFSMQKIFYRK